MFVTEPLELHSTMEALPQELIDKISSYLHYNDLKQTLFVARKFHVAAEEQSEAFSQFVFKTLHKDELESFSNIYIGRRARFLRNIEIHTSFPALVFSKKRRRGSGSPHSACYESLDQLREKDECFTQQVKTALQILKRLEEGFSSHQNPGKIRLTIYTPTRFVDPKFCNHVRYTSWRVHLLSPESLPILRSIRSLAFVNPEPPSLDDVLPKVDPRILVDLATRFPNLETLSCKLGVDEWELCHDLGRYYFHHDFAGCRRDARKDFAAALETAQLPGSLRNVQLDFVGPLDIALDEQHAPMPDMVSPAGYDPFSSALRVLSYGLRRVDLQVMADATLFWPNNESDIPTWPYLEELLVTFHIASPSGSWYFHGPTNAGRYDTGYSIRDSDYPPLHERLGDEEWHYREPPPEIYAKPAFRAIPTDELLEPFLAAFAKAAANMPKLRQAVLWAPITFVAEAVCNENADFEFEMIAKCENAELAWGLAYVAPGVRPFECPGQGILSVRQLRWKVGFWRPSAELHALLRNIGQVQYSDDLEEDWVDEAYVGGLVRCEVFEDNLY